MLTILLKYGIVEYNNNYYKQTDDIPTGFSVSPIFANLFLNLVLDSDLRNIPEIDNYTRYLDNIYLHTSLSNEQLISLLNRGELQFEITDDGK